MKAYRYIALLFLICFSAFLGHNLVPHHHHAEAFLNPIAADCPVEHSNHHSCNQDAKGLDHHSADHPSHCHAFNDVVFEKYNTQVLKPLSGQILVLAVAQSDLFPEAPVLRDFYKFKDWNTPFKTFELQGSRGLRGPPQSA
jgi:hypothetical protein